MTGGGALETLWHDARLAVRVLRKDRTFTAAAVLALTLSIGTNTALFTVVRLVLGLWNYLQPRHRPVS